MVLDGRGGVSFAPLASSVGSVHREKGAYNSGAAYRSPEESAPPHPGRGRSRLLGDAEYDTTEMLAWVQAETTWAFVMRTASNLLIQQGADVASGR